MFYDTHTHSTFSTDSVMPMEDAIKQAIKLDLSGIAFTDHLDIDYIGHETEFQYDFDEYFNCIIPLREKYASSIKIMTAVELGLQPHVIEATKERIRNYSFDYVIGSTHLIHRRDPYYGTYFGTSPKVDMYNEYLEEIYSNIHLFKEYNTLGHIDYLTRYASYTDSNFYYRDYPDILDEIFRYIIENSIALEVNTSTYMRHPLDPRILTRYKELGGYLLTIGSDAHDISRLAKLFKEHAKIIKDAGFDYLTYYQERKPQQYKI